MRAKIVNTDAEVPVQTQQKELCNFCVTNNAIFPSMEAFEMRLDIPTVYVVFYEFFLKSSVGDSKWKAACLEAKEQTERLAPPQGEAFAMLMLKNNYFSWLYEAKTKLKKMLVTDYDTDRERSGKPGAAEAFLQMELNLEREEGLDEAETNNLGQLLVFETDDNYRELKKKTDNALY